MRIVQEATRKRQEQEQGVEARGSGAVGSGAAAGGGGAGGGSGSGGGDGSTGSDGDPCVCAEDGVSGDFPTKTKGCHIAERNTELSGGRKESAAQSCEATGRRAQHRAVRREEGERSTEL